MILGKGIIYHADSKLAHRYINSGLRYFCYINQIGNQYVVSKLLQLVPATGLDYMIVAVSF